MHISFVFNGTAHNSFTISDAIEMGVPVSLVKSAVVEQLGASIDTAAGNARAAFVSPGSYIDQEYLLAKQEAVAWLESGKDANAIPSSVSDHMAMFEVDAETAATEIVTTAEHWEQALGAIRSARLGGKAAVQRAETIEAAEAAAQQAIEQLNRFRPDAV